MFTKKDLIIDWYKILVHQSANGFINGKLFMKFLEAKEFCITKKEIEHFIFSLNKTFKEKLDKNDYLLFFSRALLKGSIENLEKIIAFSNYCLINLPLTLTPLDYKHNKIFEEVKKYISSGGKTEFINSISQSLQKEFSNRNDFEELIRYNSYSNQDLDQYISQFMKNVEN